MPSRAWCQSTHITLEFSEGSRGFRDVPKEGVFRQELCAELSEGKHVLNPYCTHGWCSRTVLMSSPS